MLIISTNKTRQGYARKRILKMAHTVPGYLKFLFLGRRAEALARGAGTTCTFLAVFLASFFISSILTDFSYTENESKPG